MKILAFIFILNGVWIAFEIWRAPMMDDNGNITKPGKNLKDLWQKRH